MQWTDIFIKSLDLEMQILPRFLYFLMYAYYFLRCLNGDTETSSTDEAVLYLCYSET